MGRYIKLAFLGFAVAGCFLAGYSVDSQARHCIPPEYDQAGSNFGRIAGHGYFTAQCQSVYYGDGAGAIHPNGIYPQGANRIQKAEDFIRTMLRRLNCNDLATDREYRQDNPTYYNGRNITAQFKCRHYRTSTSFIIQSMLGVRGANARNMPTQGQINEWKERVRYAAQQNNIRWNPLHRHGITTFYSATENDVAWYDENITARSIVFRNDRGAVVYAMQKSCSNPVRDSPGLERAPPEWTMQASSTINSSNFGGPKRATAKPGQRVTFYHQMRNRGPDRGAATLQAYRNYPGQPTRRAPDSGPNPRFTNPNRMTLNPGVTRMMTYNRFRIPPNANVGQQYCQFVRVYNWFRRSNNASDIRNRTYNRPSQQACVRVAHDYNLVPTVQNRNGGVVQDGERANFTYRIENRGPTKSRAEQWRVYELVFPPERPARSIGGGFNRTCNYYRNRGANCRLVDQGRVGAIPDNRTVQVNRDEGGVPLDSYPPGTAICRILEVQNPREGRNPRDRWSATSSCAVIGKRPTVHFLGGDVAAGRPYCGQGGATDGGIYTVANGRDNGSMTEYAAFVEGVIDFQRQTYGFGTGSQVGWTRSDVRQLAFANTDRPYGEFGSGACMPDYYARYDARNLPARNGNNNLPTTGTHKFDYGRQNLIINGALIRDNASVLIVVDGNVNIRGNIRYNPPYGGTDRIPSFAIIASGNINVHQRVTRLDGVYVSKGMFNTCNPPGGRLTLDRCDRQLTVNGAVITERLNLRRTFGAGENNPEQPGERFHYTTELFFNNVLADDGDTTLDTMLQQDLPARY